jgi:Adenylate kinase and related kinases
LSQAKNLDIMLNSSNQKIDFIFFLNVKKDTIIKRIEKRKLLEKRADDNLTTILKRYDTYMETTKPVLDFYSKKTNFYEIDGSEEIYEISSKIEQILAV